MHSRDLIFCLSAVFLFHSLHAQEAQTDTIIFGNGQQPLPLDQSSAHYASTGFQDYTPLRSTGQVPQDLRDYYQEGKEQQTTAGAKTKHTFVRENAVALGYLFATGRVLYNDPISLYASAVLDTLLSATPELQGKVRVFCVRASTVNAFTTNDGKIFITIGLMARLHDRSELAFVLAHEMMHYVHGDVYQSFVLNKHLSKGMHSLRHNEEGVKQLLLTKYRRSRAQELAADSAGYALYKTSPYGRYDPMGAFDVLESARRSIYSSVPGPDFFTDSTAVLQDMFTLTGSDLHLRNYDSDTLYATHPEIEQRRALLKRHYPVGASFSPLSADDSFTEVRTIAGFELANTYYIDHDYAEGLVQANGLLGEYANNRFLEELTVKCLFGMAHWYEQGVEADDPLAYLAAGDTVIDPAVALLDNAMIGMDRAEVMSAVLFRCGKISDVDQDLDLKCIMFSASNELLTNVDLSDDSTATAADTTITSHQQKRLDALETALRADPRTAMLVDSTNRLPEVPVPASMHHDAQVVIPYLMIMKGPKNRPENLEPQAAISTYCQHIERLNIQGEEKYHALSSFGLDSMDTGMYNDYCVYADQLWSDMQVDDQQGYRVRLDRDRMNELSQRYNARYLTLSLVLARKNSFGFKLGRWALWGLLVPGYGFLVGTHCFFYKYTNKFFTVVIDNWTGEVQLAQYAQKRTQMSTSPNVYKFKATEKHLWK